MKTNNNAGHFGFAQRPCSLSLSKGTIRSLACILLVFTACDNGGSGYSNNGSSEKYDYCLLAEQKECLVGPFELSTCSGQLSNSCPAGYYTGSQAEKPSSSSRNSILYSSSSTIQQTGKIEGSPITYNGQTYKTVKIGTQTWMVENLNYNASGSVCYDNNTTDCTKYGRLYYWATAMTVCPSGWHLPSDDDWETLINYVENSNSCTDCAGKHLKSVEGWDSYSGIVNLDTYGFAALPGGTGNSDGSLYNADFSGADFAGAWWSSTEYNANLVYCISMFYGKEAGEYLNGSINYKTSLVSVRCLKD